MSHAGWRPCGVPSMPGATPQLCAKAVASVQPVHSFASSGAPDSMLAPCGWDRSAAGGMTHLSKSECHFVLATDFSVRLAFNLRIILEIRNGNDDEASVDHPCRCGRTGNCQPRCGTCQG